MSLSVHAFLRDENGQMQFVEKDNLSDLAGFESCRKNLYGNEISKKIGLKILATLAVESNLFVPFEDLPKLKKEVELMLKNLDLYEKEKNYERGYIEARLKNVLSVVENAQEIKGWVVIW